MSDPLARVTTVVRTHQRREAVQAAVRAALDQTLTGQPVLVVDDGSTDGTAEALGKAFGTRVRVIRHAENRGPGAAVNTALDAVETPFVAFLDSDDRWHPRFLETMLAALDAAPERTLAYCNYRRDFAGYDLDLPEHGFPPAALPRQARCPMPTMSVWMARTRGLRAIGPFREDLRVGEDFDAVVRVWLRNPEGLLPVPWTLATYRDSAEGASGDGDRYLADMRRICRTYEAHPAFDSGRAAWYDGPAKAAMSAIQRRHTARWLADPPSRTVSLVLVCPPGAPLDAAALRASLASAAAQRLPPVDACLVAPDAAALAGELGPDMPFTLHGVAPQEGWAPILAAGTGDLVAFLVAGDAWSAEALDLHRRAFSACPQVALFSYGGTADRAVPPGLALPPLQLAQQAIALAVPGRLSAMAVARTRLLDLMRGERLPPPDAVPSAWLSLTLALCTRAGRSVRIRRPVLDAGAAEALSPDAARAVLTDAFARGHSGWLTGLHDALADTDGEVVRAFPHAAEAPW